MAKNKRAGRRVSGNPARAAEQIGARQADDRFRREVLLQPLPPYRSPTAADWARLESETRALHPKCPDCGGRLEGTKADSGEEGADDEGNTVISMVLWCEQVDDDDTEARNQIPHPLSDGMVEHEVVLSSSR